MRIQDPESFTQDVLRNGQCFDIKIHLDNGIVIWEKVFSVPNTLFMTSERKQRDKQNTDELDRFLIRMELLSKEGFQYG